MYKRINQQEDHIYTIPIYVDDILTFIRSTKHEVHKFYNIYKQKKNKNIKFTNQIENIEQINFLNITRYSNTQ